MFDSSRGSCADGKQMPRNDGRASRWCCDTARAKRKTRRCGQGPWRRAECSSDTVVHAERQRDEARDREVQIEVQRVLRRSAGVIEGVRDRAGGWSTMQRRDDYVINNRGFRERADR